MGVENDIFWSEIGSGFEEPDGTPPLRIPSSYTPPFEQQAPAVNNNGTFHMEKELLVSVPLYSCLNTFWFPSNISTGWLFIWCITISDI